MFRNFFVFSILFFFIIPLYGEASSKYLFSRGKICWKTGRFDAAIRYFKNYQKQSGLSDQEKANSVFWTGKCYYYKWNIDKAVSTFRSVISLYAQTSVAPLAIKWIGDCYFFSRRYSSSISSYRQFVMSYPSHELVPLVLFFLGKAYLKNGQSDNSLNTLLRIISLYPSHYIIPQCRLLIRRIQK